MEDYIKKLQDKPRKERERILSMALFLAILILVGSWILLLPGRFKKDADAPQGKNPFSVVRGIFSDTYNDTFKSN